MAKRGAHEVESDDNEGSIIHRKRTRSQTGSAATTPRSAKRVKTLANGDVNSRPKAKPRAKKESPKVPQSEPPKPRPKTVAAPSTPTRSTRVRKYMMQTEDDEELSDAEPTTPRSKILELRSPTKDLSVPNSPSRTPKRRPESKLLSLAVARNESLRVRSGALSPKRRSPTKQNKESVASAPPLDRTKSLHASPTKPEWGVEDSPSKATRLLSQLRTPSKQRTNAQAWDKSAKKKAVRSLLEEPDDDNIAEDILSGESPQKKSLLQILDDQGSKALFLDGYEGYFEQHKVREKISTTKFTDVPELAYPELKAKVEAQSKTLGRERAVLQHHYMEMFQQYYFELNMGFSLLFYGLGSKHDLLNEFASSTLDEHKVLVVNGFNPDTSAREVLTQVASALLPEKTAAALPKQPIEMCNALLAQLAQSTRQTTKLTLLIHNIDGEALRNDKDQVVLSRLAGAAGIHIVASVDHLYAPLLWDNAKSDSAFKFLCHEISTYENYLVETEFDRDLTMGKENETGNSKGAQYVLASLTENSKKLYNMLLCHQMETMMEESLETVAQTGHGIDSKLFYTQCVEEFIVSNELNYRTMLTEFIEHKMIKSTKDPSGSETLFIPLTKEAVETMVEELA